MKISILTPDLSHNCLGRAYVLAKVLQRNYEVEIAGPLLGEGIWSPVVDDKSIKYKPVQIHGRLKSYHRIKELACKINGDVIYASKIETDETGFDSLTYDFQMLVPEDGTTGFASSTAYYFYVELT